jgi:DNA end-binding protein Ku
VPRERKPSRRKTPAVPAAQPPAHAAPAPAVARGLWAGSITFGLVTIPVELYAATRGAGGASLRMLASDGTPLVRRWACSAEQRLLEDDEVARGYEVEEGRYLLVTDEELAALSPRRSRDIELVRFVPRDAIDPAYFVRAYFVMPGQEQTKAYRLLAQTMEDGRRAAVASFVMRGKAAAVALFADRGVLRAATLRFGDELRSPEGIATPVKAEAEEAERFRRAIAALSAATLEPRELAEDAGAELVARAREKLARGEDVLTPRVAAGGADSAAAAGEGDESEPPSAGRGELIDLFELIQQRLRERPAERAPQKRVSAARPRARARKR